MGKKVALVYPYFLTEGRDHILFQPLGIAALASQLKGIEIEAVQFDCTFESFDSAISKICAEKPAVVGIYIMTTFTRNALRMLDRLRMVLPGAMFVAGGPLPTLYPERFAREFDCVFRGEADISFPKFCSDYISGCADRDAHMAALDVTSYPGIFFLRGGNPAASDPVHWPEQVVGILPAADRGGVDNLMYKKFWMEKDGTRTASLMTTYGCPFNCDFCSRPVFGSRLRKRPVDKVMEEVIQIKELGFDRIWIGDDCFTLDMDYVKEFCGRLAIHAPGMKWTCLSRVTAIDDVVAGMMKQGGCEKVYLGLESGDNDTLRLMNKRTSVGEGINAVNTFSRAGIKTGGFFMVGYPGETRQSVESTFNLALSLPLDEISFTVPYPLPGSPLYDRVKGLRADDDWDVENEVKFVFDTEFDTQWLKAGIEDTMQKFREKRIKV